jgi:hypothetical protein
MDIDEAPRHGRRRLTREEGGPTVWISIARLVRQPGQWTPPGFSAAISRPCASWLRMGPGDEAATGMALTRDFNERYREFGQRVLAFSLRTYRHGNIDGLKRAVGVA